MSLKVRRPANAREAFFNRVRKIEKEEGSMGSSAGFVNDLFDVVDTYVIGPATFKGAQKVLRVLAEYMDDELEYPGA